MFEVIEVINTFFGTVENVATIELTGHDAHAWIDRNGVDAFGDPIPGLTFRVQPSQYRNLINDTPVFVNPLIVVPMGASL